MFNKILRALGEGVANVIQGVVLDAVHGKKARRGREGAFKPYRARRATRRTYTRRYTPHQVVVHVYAGAHVHM